MSAYFLTAGVLLVPKADRLSCCRRGSTAACLEADAPDFGFLSSSSLALAAAARAGGLNSSGLAADEAAQPMSTTSFIGVLVYQHLQIVLVFGQLRASWSDLVRPRRSGHWKTTFPDTFEPERARAT